MCRLFGFRSAVESKAHRSLIQAENSLVHQAANHPNGWGIGYFVERDAYIIKSDDAAHTSERFHLASSRLTSQTFVVHVRKATVGITDYLNSHPFRFGRWVFAHNGTIWDFDEHFGDWIRDAIPERRRPLILGDTDSEHLFHYLLAALEDAGVDPQGHDNPADVPAAGRVLRAAIDRIFERAAQRELDPPITNFILTNGEVFFAMRAGKELYFATQKNRCGDFETCAEPSKVCMLAARPDAPVNHLIVSSERIGTEDRWEALGQGSMLMLDADYRVSFIGPPDNFGLSVHAE